MESDDESLAAVAALLRRADEVHKAAAGRAEPAAARETLARLLDEARERLEQLPRTDERLRLSAGVSRRWADLDAAALEPMLAATPDVPPAPRTVDDPARIPPGQRLTAGFPVLHVGRAPDWGPGDVSVTVTGLVGRRQVLDLPTLQAIDTVDIVRDFHCVTHWSRLDNRWTGVRLRDVLALADPRPEASHVLVSGHPAYSTNLTRSAAEADDVLLAWAHEGQPLPGAHGGPLRLVVPALYGWKSVKWVTEVRLLDRDVRGYWEERGYHDVGDPWSEQRYQGD
ncbi:MAG: molybdopterin-dependent oxidoreductase [Nitriliruptoraceae bacterium]|nr:molybdopterin-dependent oxidoreductase [Nitriliruptoraceae bacterium]